MRGSGCGMVLVSDLWLVWLDESGMCFALKNNRKRSAVYAFQVTAL
jgi:hypothetical protein